MAEKADPDISQTPSTSSADILKLDVATEGNEKEEYDRRLDGLPEKYREEILRQYDFPETKSTLLSVFRYATWVDILFMILGTLMSIASGAALPLMTVVFGNLTNIFGGFGSPGVITVQAIPSVDEFNRRVAHSALQFVYIGIGVLVASCLGPLFWTLSGERISRRIRGLYLQAVVRQNVAFFDRLGAGEVTNRVSNDAELLREGISDKVSPLEALADFKVAIVVQYLAAFFSAFVIAFVKNWNFALILSCIIPTIMAVFGVGGGFIAKFSKLQVKEYGAASTIVEEIISSVRTAQAFGAQPKLAKLYDDNLVFAQRIGYKLQISGAAMLSAMFFSIYAFYGLGFCTSVRDSADAKGEGSRLLASGGLDTGTVFTVLFAIIIGAFSLGTIGPRIEAFAKASSACHKIFQTLRRIPTIDSLDPNGAKPENIKGAIELKNVSFIYPSRPEVTVLKNVSMNIPQEKFTAVVGPSGSGKSTVLQLLERFYDPVEGGIFLDGHDIRSLNVKFLRSRMGLVSQEPVLFGTTVFENVCHGMIGTPLETADRQTRQHAVEAACKMANAHAFITELPDGYATRVGEGGFLLSGGQKQRVAIARAIVANPPILLLDEATSALDTTSERLVQEALEMASRARTTICIAHRLSTIKNADNIIVMSNGEVIEQGSHDQLYARDGMYHGLVDAQRISAESTGDGYETPEEVIEVEEDIRRTHSQGLHSPPESPALLRRSTTGRSASIVEVKNLASGEVAKTKYSVFYLLKKALYFNRQERPILLAGWACTVLTGSVYPAMALLFSYGIDGFLATNNSDLRSRSNLIALMWFVIAIIEGFAYAAYAWTFGYASEKMVLTRPTALIFQNASFFDREEHSTGTLTQMLGQEATAMSGLSGLNLGAILTVLFGLSAGVILALAYGWKLALVALSLLPVLLVTGFFEMRIIDHLHDDLRDAYGKSASLACEQIAAIRTVAALRRENALQAEYIASLNAPVRKAMISTAKSTFLMTKALLFWYGSTLIRTREYSLVSFFVCLMAITFGAQGAGQFFSFSPDISKAISATQSVTRLLEHKPDIDVASEEGKRVDRLESGRIEFQNVHFTYPARPNVPVLRGLNFEIKPGQYVALVGSSGCGKSTTIGLIERFYDPIAGQVLVDGIPVSEYNLSSYRKNISIVSQEPTLYQGTIRFNILLGADADTSQEDIDNACKNANVFSFTHAAHSQIYEFIQSLPSGYETVVGTKGSALSGGQKQRIAIARALIRNPKILLLDEATSALDSESEHLVQQAMDKAAMVEGRTTLAIAHRLSTIQNADIIFFMERGRVVERGTHEELVNKKGRYFELARQQELQKKEMDKTSKQ